MSREEDGDSKQSGKYQVLIPQEYYGDHKNDEISLLELLDVLIRRKWVVVVTFAIFTVISLVYVFTATPVYKVTASLVIGHIGQTQDEFVAFSRIEDSEALISRFNGKYGVKVTDKKIKIQRREMGLKGNTLILEKEGTSSEQLGEPVKKLLAEIKAVLDERYNRLISLQKNYALSAVNELKSIEQQMSELLRIKKRVKGEAHIEIMKEMRELTTRKTELLKELPYHELAKLQSTETIISREPKIPKSPIRPRKKLLLTLSAVLGVFLGVIFAFVLEFISKTRDNRKPA